MSPPVLKPVIIRGKEERSPGPSLRSVIRKSALLNVTIVLTSFPVLAFAGGANAVVPAFVLMAAISFVIWATTFTLFSFVSLAQVFRAPITPGKRRDPFRPAIEAGVADRWLDTPG